MWTLESNVLDSKTQHFTIHHDARALSYAAVAKLWQSNEAFCTFFNNALAEVAFGAYCWETPPLTQATFGRTFEYVVVENLALDRKGPQTTAFDAHFSNATHDDKGVVVFANLGRNAELVVPCPLAPHVAYPHIAAFVRKAPPSQQRALWQRLGETLEHQLSDKPVWVSTAGMGVPWLHIRLDARPKYYRHQSYRAFP